MDVLYEGIVTSISGRVADRGRGSTVAAVVVVVPFSQIPDSMLPLMSGVGWEDGVEGSVSSSVSQFSVSPETEWPGEYT